MKKLVVFGARQIAEVVAFYFDHDSDYSVEAFTVDGAFVEHDSLLGRPVVPFEEAASRFPPDEYEMFVALSYRKLNHIRRDKAEAVSAAGYRLARYVSSKAHTWPGLSIGANSFVMEGNVVQPFATIGDNTLIWSGNHIGHHARVGSHCFLASHIVVSGSVEIGEHCFIGVNATLRDGVKIASGCLIGAGALIMKDTEEGQAFIAAGTEPSRLPAARIPL